MVTPSQWRKKISETVDISGYLNQINELILIAMGNNVDSVSWEYNPEKVNKFIRDKIVGELRRKGYIAAPMPGYSILVSPPLENA